MKTLIVEDDFSSRLILSEFLQQYGPCHVAANGREAVDAVRAALDIKAPYDLICMDIMMPEMDGQEALRQIRADEDDEVDTPPERKWCKVIMTTALTDIKQVIKAYGNLCDAYLTKPIHQATLIHTLEKLKLI